jgi:hypothetical protein
LNHDPPDLFLLSSKDYRHEPPVKEQVAKLRSWTLRRINLKTRGLVPWVRLKEAASRLQSPKREGPAAAETLSSEEPVDAPIC